LSFSQLDEGIQAPEFSLPDKFGNKQSLSDYRGQFVILYFYPMDNTPGCTLEACTFRDNYQGITSLNAVVIGISWDTTTKHIAFADKYKLPFTLLSDTKGIVSKRYKATGWFFPKRITYIIDPGGKILKVYEDFDISTHSTAIISFLENISNIESTH
jgi:peroxiredoxin Q/BCP